MTFDLRYATKEQLAELQRHIDERKWPPNKPEERARLRAATRAAAEREQREQASVIPENVHQEEPEQMNLWREEENG